MSTCWFPDNTVLCNFAAVDRLPLLRAVLDNRGRIVEAVAAELTKSCRFYPALTTVLAERWLGDPIEIVRRHEIDHVNRVRRAVFGGTDARPTKHLGEAQTCHVIKAWPEFRGAHWITDDRDAYDYGRAQGLVTKRTADLVSEAVRHRLVGRRDGFELLQNMIKADRWLWVPRRESDL